MQSLMEQRRLLDADRRRHWNAQREHIIVASIGFEYFAGWVFLLYGLSLIVSPPSPSSMNPVLAWVQAHALPVGAIFALVGTTHLVTLFAWPHTDHRYILRRKMCSAVECFFFTLLFIAGLALFLTGRQSLFGPLMFLPVAGFLLVSVFRRRYRDW